MTDETRDETQNPTPETPQSEEAPPVATSSPEATPSEEITVMAAKEVEEGKAFAVLSYVLSLVGLPFFLVPLIMRNNAFSLFHAKQCLMLWLVGVIGGTLSGLLAFVCIGLILAPIVGILILVLCIIGIVTASKGEAKPLPVVGPWAVDWFKGITKLAS